MRMSVPVLLLALAVSAPAYAQNVPDHDNPAYPPATSGNPSSGAIPIFPPYNPPPAEFNRPGSSANFPIFNVPPSQFPYTVA